MSVELIAIVCQIGLTVFGGILFRYYYKREKADLIEKFKDEAESVIRDNMQGAIDSVGEALQELFIDPTVKKGFSLAGTLGGEAKAESGIIDQMAMDMLDSPQFAAARLGAEALGLDIEGYIEKHGALKTIKAAQQLASMAGIDLMKLDLSNLSLPGGNQSSGTNPYFRR